MTVTDKTTARTYREIEISRIWEPDIELREYIDEESLSELSESVEDHDILNPVLVTTRPGHNDYTLIAGGRRVRAAKKAKKTMIPAYVYENMPGNKALEIALIENVQRDNLEPMWEARAYSIMKSKYGQDVSEIAKRLRKRPQYIKERLALLGLPLDIQRQIEEKRLPLTSAIAITGIKGEEAQKNIAKRTEEEQLPYDIVKKIVQESAPSKKRGQTTKDDSKVYPRTPKKRSKKSPLPTESAVDTEKASATISSQEAQKKLQKIALKGEDLLEYLNQINSVEWPPDQQQKLRQAASAIQQGLSQFLARIDKNL